MGFEVVAVMAACEVAAFMVLFLLGRGGWCLGGQTPSVRRRAVSTDPTWDRWKVMSPDRGTSPRVREWASVSTRPIADPFRFDTRFGWWTEFGSLVVGAELYFPRCVVDNAMMVTA